MLDDILVWDRQAFLMLNGMGSPDFDGFWVGVTRLLTWSPLYLFFFILVFRAYPWKQAVAVLLTLLLLVLGITELTDLVKDLAARLRPNNEPELRGLARILIQPADFSFFSGHASFSFALTTAVVLFLKEQYKWIYVFYAWALLIAFSRVYVGVHYPGDVVTGALAGTLLAFLFYQAFQYISKPYKR